MLNRRHIRIKVMQSVYALLLSKDNDLDKEVKFLYLNINKLYELYVLQLNLLIEIQKLVKIRFKISKKNRVTTIDNEAGYINLIENKLIIVLARNSALTEITANKNWNNWTNAIAYVQLIWTEILESEIFKNYSAIDKPTFNQDKLFTLDIYKQIIAPNNKLFDYFESENIGWIDDIPFVNTIISKELSKLQEGKGFILEDLYKNEEDRFFVKELFQKIVLNHTDYDTIIDEQTPNWEFDRIASIDLILIKMAITEFLKFPSIPTKVTINEYLELAKDYSSDKSSFFINGVLDKLLKKYKKEEKINKIGRGLL
ncbi:MAG: transcription antitermination factor NusB [Flavobacteriaceae bacterium]|nr:transcription antitermination factor NusB [Flavobacteriaceae bacterium]